ncbi:MAG TPA: COX15/CtaA family protein [Phototrophicaceae bacterium]|nr:COX15/CtaA family protein [Phototrophicaceae bacterium]
MHTTSPRWFPRLALATAFFTLGLIVFGAVVRVTDSGLGCGDHWPLCNGTIFPPLDNLNAWIEWLHRLFALLIGVLGLITLVAALRAYRQHNRLVLNLTIAAALLFTLQSALGAIVVVLELPPTFVTLHLGTAMLLLGTLLFAAVGAIYRPTEYRRGDTITSLVYITTALSLVIILTGALVRGSGATLACADWPLCNGAVLPLNQGQLPIIHMLHRMAVLALGFSLVLLVWYVAKHRVGQARTLAIGALVAYLAQAGVGALYVVSGAAPLWGAAHVGLAATTWGLLVVLSAIEWLNNRVVSSEQRWNPQSEVSS